MSFVRASPSGEDITSLTEPTGLGRMEPFVLGTAPRRKKATSHTMRRSLAAPEPPRSD